MESKVPNCVNTYSFLPLDHTFLTNFEILTLNMFLNRRLKKLKAMLPEAIFLVTCNANLEVAACMLCTNDMPERAKIRASVALSLYSILMLSYHCYCTSAIIFYITYIK